MMKKVLIGAVLLALILGAWRMYEYKSISGISEEKILASADQPQTDSDTKLANQQARQETGSGGRPSFVPAVQNRQQFEEQMKKSGAKYLKPGKGNQTINITLNTKGGK